MVPTSSIAANNNPENEQLSQNDEMRVSYHECGHVIVSWYLKNADAPTKVTIVGVDWKLGCTTFSTYASKFWKFEEMLDKMASLLGGYAVEKLLLGGLTDGSANDMEKATEIAYELVIKFGMVKEIGPIQINYQDCSEYLKGG
uniref:Peptidase M41 domain-containing protein n=1 Tax=Meloidogyne javanica TaxID=6303 RepID=A0A915LWW1_MELJA